MINKLNKTEFLSSGTWTCPAGVTSVIVIGVGGGGGGSGTYENYQEEVVKYMGGGSNVLTTRVVSVVPNTSYTVTIGTGGSGGAPGSGSTGPTGGSTGGNGGDTLFGSEVFKGAPGAFVVDDFSLYSSQIRYTYGVSPIGASDSRVRTASSYLYYNGDYLGAPALKNWQGSTGTGTSANGRATAGDTGINDYAGTGGIGGDGGLINASLGSVGGNAPANSGAGGGAGGLTNTPGVFSSTRFSGGDGGSGRLIIMWVE